MDVLNPFHSLRFITNSINRHPPASWRFSLPFLAPIISWRGPFRSLLEWELTRWYIWLLELFPIHVVVIIYLFTTTASPTRPRNGDATNTLSHFTVEG